MLILSLHHGPHDSAAAIFDDYSIVAAIAEERMNRSKCSGGFPELAIAEVFRIASVRPRQIDALVCTRSFFRRRYYTHMSGFEKLRQETRRLRGREKPLEMNVVLGADPSRTAYDIFDATPLSLPSASAPALRFFFTNRHFSHALPALSSPTGTMHCFLPRTREAIRFSTATTSFVTAD